MKKFFVLAAVAAVTLASCAKIETYKVSENNGQMPIGFTNSYVPKSLVRADATYVPSTTLINSKKYCVYSYATANGDAFATGSVAALGTKFMDAVEVEYQTGGNSDASKNVYSPVRYWPSGDDPDWLTFWAYYPKQAGNGIVYTAPTGSNGVGSYAFTAATTAAAMVDFMVSDVVNDKIYGEVGGAHVALNGVVPLTFKHQLTKIAVKIKTDNTDATTKVVLTNAQIKEVRTTGTLTTTYAAGVTSTDWGSSAAIVDANTDGHGDVVYSVTISGSAISNNVLTTTPVGGADADLFLMVPQTTVEEGGSNPQYFEISWDVKTFDNSTNASAASAATVTSVGTSGLLSITHNTQVVYLDNITVKENADGTGATKSNDWAKNQWITYTVTVGPKPIKFTASAEDWDDETFGNVSVQ